MARQTDGAWAIEQRAIKTILRKISSSPPRDTSVVGLWSWSNDLINDNYAFITKLEAELEHFIPREEEERRVKATVIYSAPMYYQTEVRQASPVLRLRLLRDVIRGFVYVLRYNYPKIKTVALRQVIRELSKIYIRRLRNEISKAEGELFEVL